MSTSVKKLLKRINNQLRKSNGNTKSSDKLNNNHNIPRRDLVVPILNWENVSSWWPRLLAFIQGQPVKLDKEIGAYFQLNPDSETQMNWFSEHRRTLEDTFQVKCACGDQNQNEETFIRNSKCVVLYVEESKFERNNDLSESQKRALTQCAASKDCSVCTVFDHFQGGGNETIDNKMANDYRMILEGNGMLLHWVYLMNNLGLVDLRRKGDTNFYSSLKDENYPIKYDEEQRLGERALTSMTSRDGIVGNTSMADIQPSTSDISYNRYYAPHVQTTIDYVCYQLVTPMSSLNDDNGSAPNQSCVTKCCLLS